MKDTKEMKSKLADFRKKIIELRKKGEDVLIADIRAKGAEPKIKMAEATKSARDFQKAQKYLEAVQKEIEEISGERFKRTEKNDMTGLVNKMDALIRSSDMQAAKIVYKEIVGVYNNLPSTEKKLVYAKLATYAKKLT